MNRPKTLLSALNELNTKLSINDIHIELTIVGSMAIYLNGLNFTRMTEDIDYINYEASDEFLNIVEHISKEFNLPSYWINSRAKEIDPLPQELKNKLKSDNRYSNIALKYIDIETAIIMKVYAYYIRGLEKDLSDLKTLSPSSDQLSKGIDYIKMQIIHHHGKSQYEKDAAEIARFLEFLKHELN